MMDMLLFDIVVFAAIAIICLIIYLIKKENYEETEYYNQTHNSFGKVRSDLGLKGEFAAYEKLKSIKGYKRYLFNLYLPKDNGETTELDVVLLHESGIYVFESKNYSGWIFGSESQKYWTQTLPNGRGRARKEQFYNPIWQNKGHLKWLQEFLGNQELSFYSYIVFSEHCTLKKITLTSGRHFVVKREDLLAAVQQNVAKAGAQLSPDKIDALYQKLYSLTQIDEAQKIMHIQNVKNIQNIQQKKQVNPSPVASTPSAISAGKIVCPQCGAKLIVRTASKGSNQGKRFLGCSNYPKCRYIKSLPDGQ